MVGHLKKGQPTKLKEKFAGRLMKLVLKLFLEKKPKISAYISSIKSLLRLRFVVYV